MNVHPQTATYRALILCIKDDNRINALSNAAQDGYKNKAQFFLSDTLAQTFNNRSSALTGAAITVLALAEPFIAAGAAVGFWYFFARPNGFIRAGYRKRTRPPRL